MIYLLDNINMGAYYTTFLLFIVSVLPYSSAIATDWQPVSKGYIGVRLSLNDKGMPYIYSVFPDTPAARVGLRAGDIILRVDGDNAMRKPLLSISRKIIGPLGTAVNLLILRDGRVRRIAVVRDKINIAYTGIIPVDYKGSIYVLGVQDGSAADIAGLESVDEILAINGQTTAGLSVLDFIDMTYGFVDTEVTLLVRKLGAPEGKTVTLILKRKGPIEEDTSTVCYDWPKSDSRSFCLDFVRSYIKLQLENSKEQKH